MSDRKYKVGDKVIARSDLTPDRSYDNLFFPAIMGKYRGNVYTILEVFYERNQYRYHLGDTSLLEEAGYKWTFNDSMLEPTQRERSSVSMRFQK